MERTASKQETQTDSRETKRERERDVTYCFLRFLPIICTAAIINFVLSLSL
jgi:hypothetical protein